MATRLMGAMKAASWNAQERTIDCVFSTGAGVRRSSPSGDWIEILSMAPDHVNLSRVDGGAAPVLNAHRGFDMEDQIGKVVRAWFEGGNLCATLRIGTNPTAQKYEKDIADGTISNVSVGYVAKRFQEDKSAGGEIPTWRCVDWEILEISFVPIPADPGAGTRSQPEEPQPVFVTASSKNRSEPQKGDNTDMNERERVLFIHDRSARNGMTPEFIRKHIEAGSSVEVVKDEILKELEKRNSPTAVRGSSVQVGQDEVDRVRSCASAYFEERLLGNTEKAQEAGRFRGRRVEDVARSLLEARGVSTANMDKTELAMRSFHSSSDLPLILSSTVEKKLAKAYEAAPQTFAPIVTTGSLSDFKETGIVQLSSGFSLEEKPEGGEMRHDSVKESAEKIRLKTFAKSMAFTREMLINDDIGALDRVPQIAARGAMNLESDLVWSIFKENPIMGDGKKLISKEHKNLHGKAMPITVDSLAEAIQAMRLQTGLDEREVLNLTPATIIVPPSQELAALRLMATNYVPQNPSDVNVYGGLLKNRIVEPRLEGLGLWYLATDKTAVDLILAAYLDGKKGLQMKTIYDDDRLAVKFNFHMDIGARPMDWRGFYAIPLK